MTPEGIKLEGDLDLRITRKTGRKLTALIVIVAGRGRRSDRLSVLAFAAKAWKPRNNGHSQLPSEVKSTPSCLLRI